MSEITIHTNHHNKNSEGRSPEIESYIEKTVDWACNGRAIPVDSFLDLGCDYGYGAHYAAVHGYSDPDKTFGVELYGQSVPSVPTRVLKEALDDALLAPKIHGHTGIKHFDRALLNHVLEHLQRPYDFMSAANPLFLSGAQMMIAVPHVGYDWAYWEGHYTVWDIRMMEKYMGHFGWQLADSCRQCFRGDNVELWALFEKE